ncbi:MAG: DUF2066 domain-containing protein [Gammaproteobacteria bacterium]|nr:DUF2066 domain-containing protein [Gammaproteobacteria bacterium]
MFLALRNISLLTLLLISSAVSADIYDRLVAVEDRSAPAREQAFTDGLRDVLKSQMMVRYLDEAQFSTLLERSDRYVDNYAYQTSEDGEIFLNVRYSDRLVLGDLRDLSAVIVPEPRARVLLVMAHDMAGASEGRQVVGEDSMIYDDIYQTFSNYNIELLVPSWDLSDRINIGVSEVWQQDLNALANLRERYPSDCVLFGAMYQSRDQSARANWYGRCWDLARTTLAVGADVSEAVEGGLELMMGFQRQRMGVALATDAARYRLTVHNINSYDDYASLFSYLASMFQVTDVVIRSVRGSEVTIEVAVLDDINKWRLKLRQDEKLTVLDSANFAWSESSLDGN